VAWRSASDGGLPVESGKQEHCSWLPPEGDRVIESRCAAPVGRLPLFRRLAFPGRLAQGEHAIGDDRNFVQEMAERRRAEPVKMRDEPLAPEPRESGLRRAFDAAIFGTVRSQANSIPSPAVPRCGVSFCAHRSWTLTGGRFRALGKGVDEIAEPPTIFAIAYSDRRRNFFGAVQAAPVRQGNAPILSGLPAV
jgi:hypothetical protein